MALDRALPYLGLGLGLAALVAAAASCGSSTAPKGGGGAPHGIVFTAGNNQTDTVDTPFLQALDVRVEASHGGHQAIQFASVVDSATSQYEAFVESLTDPVPTTVVADSTDSAGRAAVIIVLGQKAGIARVVVSVPALSLVDTATFTVKPGNVGGVRIMPRDTVAYKGVAVAIRVSTVDRHGNARSSDTVAVTRTSGPATLTGSTVTMTGIGVAHLSASTATYRDTTSITGVPHGTIAATDFSSIHIMNLDGSGAQTFTPQTLPVGNMKWAPSGQQFVYDQSSACDALGSSTITTDLLGQTHVIDINGQGYDQYPSYSHDGAWVYTTRLDGSVNSSALWRVHPDGTGGDSLPNQMPAIDVYPSPSVDGSQVVYLGLDGTGNAYLRILTVATGAVNDLRLNAWSPQWSPTADEIAYINSVNCAGTIALIHSDGSGARVLTSGSYSASFDWSPDGAYIVARNDNTGYIDIIDATTGNATPLPYSSGLASPTWLPTSPPTGSDRLPHGPASSTRIARRGMRAGGMQKQ